MSCNTKNTPSVDPVTKTGKGNKNPLVREEDPKPLDLDIEQAPIFKAMLHAIEQIVCGFKEAVRKSFDNRMSKLWTQLIAHLKADKAERRAEIADLKELVARLEKKVDLQTETQKDNVAFLSTYSRTICKQGIVAQENFENTRVAVNKLYRALCELKDPHNLTRWR